MSKEIAHESEKVKKIREKIKNNYCKLERRINSEAMEKTKAAMYYWIATHSDERVSIKMNRMVSLFDENQNSAQISRFVRKAFDKISEEDTISAKKWNNREVSHILPSERT